MSVIEQRVRPKIVAPEASKIAPVGATIDAPLTLVRPDGKGKPIHLGVVHLDSLMQPARDTQPFSEKGKTCPSCPSRPGISQDIVLLQKDQPLSVNSFATRSDTRPQAGSADSVPQDCCFAKTSKDASYKGPCGC